MEHEPTIGDVLEAVNKGFQGVQNQLHGLDTRMTNVEGRLTKVESNMATKDFVERRFERTDAKINMLVHVLAEKRILTDADRQAVRLA